MSPMEFAVNFFIALFALIDPVGNVPLFAAATGGASTAGRRLTSLYIAAFALGFLTFFYLTGVALLQFFGISLPAFRIAGGVLLFLMGLDMARGDMAELFSEAGQESEVLSTRAYARKRFEGLIVPFAMPLLIGPGAISTVVIYASEAKALGDRRHRAVDRRLVLDDRPDHPRARPHRDDHRGACAGLDPVRHGRAGHPRRPGRFHHRPCPPRRCDPVPVGQTLRWRPAWPARRAMPHSSGISLARAATALLGAPVTHRARLASAAS